MLKERDEPIGDLLRKVAENEEELEAVRQLLNEEIEFSIAQSYLQLKGDNQRVDARCIRGWLGEGGEEAIESVLKYYGEGRLHISQQEWGRMVLTREDQLLAKLTRERTHLAPVPLPNYLLNYCRKIWAKECELHRAICAARAAREAIQKWLGWVRGEGGVNEEKLKQFCATISQEMGASCPTTFTRVKRYLLQSSGDEKIQMGSLEALLLRSNVPTIQQYLKVKEQQHLRRVSKAKVKKNPFLHTEFQKMDEKEQHCAFSFRQLQSIERHISRNKTLPTATAIRSRIREYTAEIEKSLTVYFTIVKEVAALFSKINRVKEQLQKEHSCNWKLLFKEITKNATIVPSELQHYLQTAQIQLSLQQLFVLFKRHADSITGRMTATHFANIFKTHFKPKQLPSSVSAEARKAALSCLKKQIKLQSKIQQLKRQLLLGVDLRDIYDALDQDSDGLVTITDVQVLCLRVTGTRIKSEDLQQLWWRMGAKSSSEMLDYQRFMYEMIPRTKEPLRPSSN